MTIAVDLGRKATNKHKIFGDIPPKMKSENMVTHSNALLQLSSNWSVASRMKPHVIQRNVTIYCRKFLTLPNQTQVH